MTKTFTREFNIQHLTDRNKGAGILIVSKRSHKFPNLINKIPILCSLEIIPKTTKHESVLYDFLELPLSKRRPTMKRSFLNVFV